MPRGSGMIGEKITVNVMPYQCTVPLHESAHKVTCTCTWRLMLILVLRPRQAHYSKPAVFFEAPTPDSNGWSTTNEPPATRVWCAVCSNNSSQVPCVLDQHTFVLSTIPILPIFQGIGWPFTSSLTVRTIATRFPFHLLHALMPSLTTGVENS